jgi:ABC-type transporter Mla MlaB component
MNVFPAILAQTLPPAQEAALKYANGRADDAARVLERALDPAGTGGSDPGLWALLFTLYRLEGEWQRFDALAQRFEQTFGAPAPVWMTKEDLERLPAELRRGGSGYLELAGVLDGKVSEPLEAVRELARGHSPINLDVTRVSDVDAEGCARLREALLFAAEHGNGVLLTGAEPLTRLLREAADGNGDVASYWLLLLEVQRLRGQQGEFQRTAFEYALATSASPPEWQPVFMPVLASASVSEKRDEPRYQTGPEAITLSGVLFAGHPQLDGLPEFAAPRQYVNVNLAQVSRMDWAGAAALARVANELVGAGKVVRLIHPNALIATLLPMLELDPRVQLIEAG